MPVSVYKGASGAKDSRPSINDLLADSGRRCFDAILVWKLNRLGRSLIHLVRLVEEFKELGVD